MTQTESLSLDCEITIMTCKSLESLFKKKTKQNHKHIKLRIRRGVSKKLGVMFGKSFPSFLHSLQSWFHRVKAVLLVNIDANILKYP